MINTDKSKARRLHLDAALLSRSLSSGQFRSLRHGVHGVDFAGVREYTLNDDARQIDWNVTARSSKTYIKLFEEDRDMQVCIILDRSRSMFTGSGGRTRYETATEAARLVVMAAEMKGIKVSLIEFDSGVCSLIPPKAGAAAAGVILSRLNKAHYPTKEIGSGLDAALLSALYTLKKRSCVMVFSDFRTAPSLYASPLTALASRHDVVSVLIADKMDSAMPNIGSVRFTDTEGGGTQILPTSSNAFKREWKKNCLGRLASFRALCDKRGVINTVLSTEDDVLKCLLKVFSRGESTKPIIRRV